MEGVKRIKVGLQCKETFFNKERMGKHGKVEVERKWWVSAHPSHSLQGNARKSPEWKPAGDRPPTRKIPGRTSIIKGWEDKRDLGRIPDTFT